MEHTEQYFRDLARKWDDGTITPEEAKEYLEWYNADDGLPVEIPQEFAASKEELEERMLASIRARMERPAPVVPMRRRRTGRIAAIAAVIITLIGIAMWWKLYEKPTIKESGAPVAQTATPGDILPGGNRAILTLADGTVIDLDSAKTGMLAEQGATTILKTSDGQVVYNEEGQANNEVKYNTIATPAGGQYMIVLPDGSKVMLNAASSLRYPAQFTGAERRVTLTGEGYFEVVHNAKQPFITEVNGAEVHDLGTEFNINAYADEPALKATLVSGRAEMRAGSEIKSLVPGQAAILKDRQIKVIAANVAEATAWRNGLFQFDHADVQTIMRQVARWYDVEVMYEGKIPKKEVTGKVLRNSTLSEMLKILKLINIDFKIEGRKIIISE